MGIYAYMETLVLCLEILCNHWVYLDTKPWEDVCVFANLLVEETAFLIACTH